MHELTPTEEAILSLSNEGKSDAEIAVRLGLTVPQLRERRERLLAYTPMPRAIPAQPPAVAPRQDLPRRRPPRWALLAGGAFVAAWLVFGIYLRATESSVTPTVQADPAMAALGRVILTPRGEAIAVDQRPAMTVLAVPEGTRIRSFDTRAWSESFAPNSLDLYGNVDSAWVRLHFVAEDGASLVQMHDGGVAVTRVPGHGGELHLFVDGHTNSGEARTVAADAGGRVQVARTSLPPEAVINWTTGEVLDVSGAVRLGKLSPGWGSTHCALLQFCFADWVPQSAGLPAPFIGNVRCAGDGSMRLDDLASGYTVRVQRLGERCGSSEFVPAGQLPATAMAGSPVASAGGIYFLTALESDSKPASIAVAGDGTIYAGDIRPKIGCPCLPDATNGEQLVARW